MDLRSKDVFELNDVLQPQKAEVETHLLAHVLRSEDGKGVGKGLSELSLPQV